MVMSNTLADAAESFGGVALSTAGLFLGASFAAGAMLIPQAMPILDKAGASVIIGGSAAYGGLEGALLGGVVGLAVGGITRLTTIFSKSAAAKNATATIAEGIGWLGLVVGLALGLCLGFSSGYRHETDGLQKSPEAKMEIQKAPLRLDMQRLSDGYQFNYGEGNVSSLRCVRG